MRQCINHIILTACILLWGGINLNAQNDKKSLENKRKKLQQEISDTEKLIKETKKSKTLSLSQLKILNKKIEDRKKLIIAIQGEINMLSFSIASNDQEIAALQKNLNMLKKNYGRMLRKAYMQRNKQSLMLLVFSSKDIHQAYKRLRYLQTYNSVMKEQARIIKNTQSDLSAHIIELKTDISEKQQLLGTEEHEKKELNEEKSEQEETIIKLKKKEAQLRKDLKRKQGDEKKLNTEIQRVIEREIARERALAMERSKANKAKIPEKTKKPSNNNPERENKPDAELAIHITPETKILSGKFESNRGLLPWPVESGVITETFGKHAHPVLKNITTYNNGIDIGTKIGAFVKSIFEGEVSGVISIPGANMAVIIKHGEFLSVYGNLSSVSVQKGARVNLGQVIGKVATDIYEGKSEAHLEIWKGKTKLNPTDWIAR